MAGDQPPNKRKRGRPAGRTSGGYRIWVGSPFGQTDKEREAEQIFIENMLSVSERREALLKAAIAKEEKKEKNDYGGQSSEN